jgi:hypothetical protein
VEIWHGRHLGHSPAGIELDRVAPGPAEKGETAALVPAGAGCGDRNGAPLGTGNLREGPPRSWAGTASAIKHRAQSAPVLSRAGAKGAWGDQGAGQGQRPIGGTGPTHDPQAVLEPWAAFGFRCGAVGGWAWGSLPAGPPLVVRRSPSEPNCAANPT